MYELEAHKTEDYGCFYDLKEYLRGNPVINSALKEKFKDQYEKIFNVIVKEIANRGWFKDVGYLRPILTEYLKSNGIDWVMENLIPQWLAEGKLHIFNPNITHPSRSAILYNGDADYRHKSCCLRKIREILENHNCYPEFKTIIKQTKKGYNQQVIEKYIKREEPLKIELTAGIGVDKKLDYELKSVPGILAFCVDKAQGVRLVYRNDRPNTLDRLYISPKDVAEFDKIVGDKSFDWIPFDSELIPELRKFYSSLVRKYRLQ